MNMQALDDGFDRFTSVVSRWLARPVAFILALVSIVLWAITGPWFHYSDSWQIFVNTGTTIITFLMVFILLASGSRDSESVQIKLDSLILANEKVDNRLMALETRTGAEIKALGAEVHGDPAPLATLQE